ncbi:aldehyde dehydrogenase family protein [Azospirillum sp. YIM B02556]|uniref:Aldehyde dehydrogenase family protein n=1 Tax=Azospirillum endophyticum TaxID=2800326 RepID=A0ABS1FHK7_9PROT|nr:aldehyde dehydrogenase family protein [Azospirillum endophyticum]
MTNLDSRQWIDGAWVPGTGRFASINPADGSVVGHAAEGGRAEAEAAIAAAHDAFNRPDWAQNPRLRQSVLLGWADRLDAQAEDLARLLTLENGKAIAQSRGEIAGAISEIRYYGGLARHVPGHVLEVEPGVLSTMLREPAGVAALIIPWNAPAVLLARAIGPALACGCTVVVKPAAQTTLLTAAFLRALSEVPGLPRGVCNMISETGHSAAARLVDSPLVDVVSFTGSTATGKRIMVAAADTMKKLSLELGGKSCCVVFPDADPAETAARIATAATIISGQQCTAARRVLVHASAFDAMKTHLRAALAAMTVGNGLDPAIRMGPLIDRPARDQVQAQVERAFDACDEVLLRGGMPADAPAAASFLTPSLVAHDDPSAFFCQDEIFGPFVVLERFETEAEAVAKANNTVFGLSASVWTRDGARALRVARALRNGTVWINDHNRLFAEAETGGYRQSGLGRLHGYDAFADFTELKHVCQTVGTIG